MPNSDAFLTFWAKYPRKVAKLAAIKAWNRLNPNMEVQMKISYYIEVHDWPDDVKFIPYPATFLNGRRWEDEEPRQDTITIDTTLTPEEEDEFARLRVEAQEKGWI